MLTMKVWFLSRIYNSRLNIPENRIKSGDDSDNTEAYMSDAGSEISTFSMDSRLSLSSTKSHRSHRRSSKRPAMSRLTSRSMMSIQEDKELTDYGFI